MNIFWQKVFGTPYSCCIINNCYPINKFMDTQLTEAYSDVIDLQGLVNSFPVNAGFQCYGFTGLNASLFPLIAALISSDSEFGH